MKRFISIFATVTLVFILIIPAGCKKKSKFTKLTLGYIPIADCAQLYVGVEKGYFKEKGIKLELVSLAGGAKILEALGAGSVDIGFSNVVSLIISRASGLKFIAITGGPVEDEVHKEHAIMIAKESSITKPKDLEGKIIALNTIKNIDDLMVRRYLEKYNVDANKVQFIEIPFPRMESVLLSGEVDAIATIEPFVTFALLHGEAKVLDYNYVVIAPRVEISSYDVTEEWLGRNPGLAKGFIEAFDKATDYCQTHEEDVRRIITKYTKLDSTIAHKITLPLFEKRLSISSLQGMADELYERDFIDKKIDVKQCVFTP